MKKRIVWGLTIIFASVAIILDSLGVLSGFESSVGEISLLSVVLSLILLAFIAKELMKGKISMIFIPLSFIFMLFEKNISVICRLNETNFISNWLVFGCAILLSIGFSVLFPKNLKIFRGKINGPSVRYIDAKSLVDERAENNFSTLLVRFENADRYVGEGSLRVENNFGTIVIEVPSYWICSCDVQNHFGSIEESPSEAKEKAPVIYITGENNFGTTVIKRI